MTRTIRTLALAEIATLLDWAAAEGWNPGLNDAVAFHAADRQGFFGAFVDGVMVAAISALAYDASFGFIGLYICHRDWRGRGHGKAVWDAGMAYLGARTIGLDAVPQQQANYASMGFVPAYETIRMSGDLVATGPALPAARLEHIRNLDRQCFPARRDDFLHYWLAPPNRGMAIVGDDGTKAYAVLRACHSGLKIGPLFARDMDAATGILTSVSGHVHIDVPAAQTAWLEVLSARGFGPGFRTTRMYRGSAPATNLTEVFGVSSLELG